MKIALVAAYGQNRVLGANNQLPWRLPDDLKRFKAITLGSPVIVGRKTYESIPEKFRPLPERTNIVVTRNKNLALPGCLVVNSLEEALAQAEQTHASSSFVIGGAQMYALALPLADTMYVTYVEANPDGDAFFPTFDEAEWQLKQQEAHPMDENHQYPFEWRVYEKKYAE